MIGYLPPEEIDMIFFELDGSNREEVYDWLGERVGWLKAGTWLFRGRSGYTSMSIEQPGVPAAEETQVTECSGFDCDDGCNGNKVRKRQVVRFPDGSIFLGGWAEFHA